MRRTRDSYIISSLLAYSVLGFIVGRLLLYGTELALITERSWKAALFLLLAFLAVRFRQLKESRDSLLTPMPFVAAFILFLCSDVFGRPFGFFQSSLHRVDLLYLGLFAGLPLLFVSPKLRLHLFSVRGLLFFQLALTVVFLDYADGRLIFSDDHPSFLYRLHLLQQHFPFIPFYNPDWNAGYSAREFFPSGVLNVFVLSYPLLLFIGELANPEVVNHYTKIIPYLFVFIVPAAVVLAARVLGLSKAGAAAAGILALGPSTGYFEWLLKYGTIGFSVSTGLVPLTIALSLRLGVLPENPRYRDALFLFFAASLCLTWTLSFVAMLPVLLLALVHFRRLLAPLRRPKIILFIFLFALLNAPWMYTFLHESKVATFLAGDTLPGSTSTSFDGGRKPAEAETAEALKPLFAHTLDEILQAHRRLLAKVNPLLLLFFLPGIRLIPRQESRLTILSTILWLLLLSAVGDELKPQLELRRMVLPAAFLMCLPAGALLVRLFQAGTEAWQSTRLSQRALGVVLTVIVLGSTLLTPLTVGAVYLNRSDERYLFSDGMALRLAEAIREHGGEGRTFFVGFILQELEATSWNAQDGGHIGLLPMFADKPMYASDFYHSRWSTVDPIPQSFRKDGSAGIERFLDLVNATAVITFKREWADYCLKRPEKYREVYREGRFRLFVRDTASTYFLEGSGTVETLADGILVTPHTDKSVIKFRYLPKLKTDSPHARIYPVPAFIEDLGGGKQNQVYYIGLEVTEEAEAQIRMAYR